jgi:hypothetical protein
MVYYHRNQDSQEVKRVENKIGSFSADFRDGKVLIGGKAFPAGYFFVNAMNEYWKEPPDPKGDWEIAYRLMVMRFSGERVLEGLTFGILEPRDAEKLYDEILYKVQIIKTAQPFRFLNWEEELARCKRLFSEKSAEQIRTYLRERSLFHYENDHGWENHPLPTAQDAKRFRKMEALLSEYKRTIRFYAQLGHGMDSAREIGRAFVAALEAPIKRTEQNLMHLALECVDKYRPSGFTEFDRVMNVKTEYVPLPKSGVGRRLSFERFGDFLLTDLFEGIHAGHYPLRCGVCKRYFLQASAHRRKYCDGYAPNDPKDRSCEAFAARTLRLEKELAPDHPVRQLYAKRRGTIDKHVQRGKLTAEQAQRAKRYISDLQYKALSDNSYFLNGYSENMEQDAVYKAVGITL